MTKKELIAYYKEGVSLNKLSTLITNHFLENPNYENGKTIHNWLVGKSKSINQYDREFGKMFCKNLLICGLYWEALSELNYQLKNEDYYTFSEKEILNILIKIKNKLETQVISGIHIYKLSWLTQVKPLTNFGNRNLSDVLKYIDIVINEEYKDGFLEDFYKFNENGKLTLRHPLEYYSKYFTVGKQAEKEFIALKKSIHQSKKGIATENQVILAISNACAQILRDAENKLRVAIGGKKIGEYFISETELFYKIKKIYSELDVYQHGRPSFLGRQHYDIWIPSLKVAIEYQGTQHDRPVDFFGGIEAFNANKKRDERKRNKSNANNVLLIEVRPNYDIKDVINKIDKRISENAC